MFEFNKNKETQAKFLPAANGETLSHLILDVSGSMSGRELRPNKLEAAKNASFEYLEQLREFSSNTRVSVTSFSDKALIECQLLPVFSHFDLIVRSIKKLKTRGSTDMGKALKKAEESLPKGMKFSLLQVVLLSDGYHNGRINPVPIAMDLKNKRMARIDCVGVGKNPRNVDEPLLKRIASLDENGRPRYHFIKDSFELVEHFKNLAGYLTRQ